MGFLICAGALLLAVFGFTFYSYSFSLDFKNAKIAKTLLIILGILGAVLMCLSAVLFLLLLSNVKAEKEVIIDSFVLFAVVDIVLVFVGLFVTFVSSALKSFLRPVIPVFLPMWGIITLFWTWICFVWSDFDALNTSPLVILFGVGASFFLTFSALPQIYDRIKLLTDEKSRGELIGKIRAKRAKREKVRYERKRLREQKKRLKHPKRK